MEYFKKLITREPVKEPEKDRDLPCSDSKEDGRKNEEFRLRHAFRRPINEAPRHPIYSSPYAKQIAIRAFGPKKPRWFRYLDSLQLFLFKELLNQIESARQEWFRLGEFIDTFKDFDPTTTRSEIVNIIDSMEKDEFEELDFGKFLFLLAYGDEAASTHSENMGETLSSKVVTPRQILILSAIAHYILIASMADIARFYLRYTRRKPVVFQHHMEATKLYGLSEAEMEEKQLEACLPLKKLFDLTGSPYALPVPFVTRFTKGKIYKEWKKSKYSLPIIDPQPKPMIKLSARERANLEPEIQRTINQMRYGKIPLPIMKFPKDKVKKMRKSCTVEMKDYIMARANQAKRDMRAHLKKAAVLHAKSALVNILLDGFPTEKEKYKFVGVYQRYFPLKESEIQNFSLWIEPEGYREKRDIKKVNPEKYAFGTKIR